MKELKMWTDPVVQEVLAIRKALMEQAGGDLHQAIAIAHQARDPERKLFRGQPRRPVGWLQDGCAGLNSGSITQERPDSARITP
jgi:hypothetical protein